MHWHFAISFQHLSCTKDLPDKKGTRLTLPADFKAEPGHQSAAILILNYLATDWRMQNQGFDAVDRLVMI